MSTYTTLVILCGLVIFSYLFDLFAKRTRFPSVVLLMLLGIGISLLTKYLGVVELARRDTFIIDPQGRVAKHYVKVDPAGHAKAVLDLPAR